jgi:sulfhydrogenase subunit alpha
MKLHEEKLIARIEGHGHLEMDLGPDGGVKLVVDEGERLFEKMLVGRDYDEAPWITPRICGVCPEAHNLATIKALEDAMGIKVSPTTTSLRELLLHAQNIVSHVLHVFFLAAPDYLGIDSALELIEKDKPTFDLVIQLKKTADRMMEVIGGRVIHPMTTCVGGFTKVPTKAELEEIKAALESILDPAVAAATLVLNFAYPELAREDTEFLGLKANGSYPFYDGNVISTKGLDVHAREYQTEIFTEDTRTYSSAKFSTRNHDSFQVGALARVNLHNDKLLPKAKALVDKGLIKFPSTNAFHINACQAIELVHEIEDSIRLLGEVLLGKVDADIVEFKVKAGRGGSAIEAPRGLLFNTMAVDDRGKLSYVDIVTPTAQNLHNLEHYANILFHATADKKPKERHHLLEMLVRAYDPCVTCSVH